MGIILKRKGRRKPRPHKSRQRCQLERLREGWARPASERFFLGEPGDALTLTAGAAGAGSVVREKIPVACGKSSAGMSAPPLQRWHARQ